MSALFDLPLLYAAADNRLIKYNFPMIGGENFQFSSVWIIVIALIAVCFGLGIAFANAIRMRDYGWKVGLIAVTWALSIFAVLFGTYKLGVDLQGGVILVYEVDEEATRALNPDGKQEWSMSALVGVIGRRLNPDGLKEIVVRPFGPKQVEVVVPEVDEAEIAKIEEIITTGGALQFMIVAGDSRDNSLFELAREQAGGQNRLSPEIKDESGQRIGYWVALARENTDTGLAPFRTAYVLGRMLRDRRTGQIIEIPAQIQSQLENNEAGLSEYLSSMGIRQVDILMAYEPEYAVSGENLANPYAGHDERGRPAIYFQMRGDGVFNMGALTQRNVGRYLGIVFDNQLLSAPVIQSRISDSGQITGNFTQEEVDFIVGILKSGSMPVVLHKNPISKNLIGSILGYDTIVKGSWSVVGALLAVLVFMVGYYRFAGLVASLALALNLLLTVGIMIILRAPLTLPGLAGLVLTVGMSVDANVLIFERIREELARGAAFRMAIRNGFDKAFSAIMDGNITTLLTAMVLYAIGTDQVRGFGITLIFGNLTSLYTAVFCARVVFDIAERTRWLKTLSMARFLTNPTIDWCKWFVPATSLSAVVILIGLVATVARGKGLFDIDLAGGTSVTFILKEPMPSEVVRSKVAEVLSKEVHPETKASVSYSVNEVAIEREKPQTVYRVDSSLPEVTELQAKLREAFKTSNGEDGLKTFYMEFGPLKESAVTGTGSSRVGPTSVPGITDGTKAGETKASQPSAQLRAPENVPDAKASDDKKASNPKSSEAAPNDAKAAEPKTTEPKTTEPKTTEPKATEPQESKSKAGETESPESPAPANPESPAPASEPSPADSESSDCQETEPPPATADAGAQEAAPPAAPAAEAPASDAPAAAPATEPAENAATDRPASEVTRAEESDNTSSPSPTAANNRAPNVETTVEIRFPEGGISAQALLDRIATSAQAAIQQNPQVEVDNPNWDQKDNSAFNVWTVKFALPKEQTEDVVKHLKGKLANEVAWQTSSKIGGQVSSDTRFRAVGAIAVSLLGILAYIWFRFQRAVWGIAAIAALAHDALFMLGAIAVSYWLAGPLGFLQIDEFKISLPVVAGFLTLIGYSVNDTIVIFDRIREIRGKSPDLTREMINAAVNQTLSRTIITGGLTLMVVTVLYFFGGPGIHAFAFAMVIGVIAGSYSTVFIAAPLLVWLMGRKTVQPTRAEAREMLRTPSPVGRGQG